MADLTKTITNSLSVLAPTPANVWGTMVWGEDNWGESKDFELQIGKWLAEGLTLTDSQFLFLTTKITDSFTVSSSIDLIALTDSSGYTYILKGASDPNDRNFPVYVESDGSTPTYIEDSGTDPGWSET